MGAKKKKKTEILGLQRKLKVNHWLLKTVCPLFKLLGVHMIVCFRPFFSDNWKETTTLRVYTECKASQGIYSTYVPLPPFPAPPILNPLSSELKEFSFYYIREVTLYFGIWFYKLKSFRSDRLTKSWRNRDLTLLRFCCCTFIAPPWSELADNGVFTFILFLVSSGHVSVKRKLSLRLKTLHLMFVVWSTFHVSETQWRSQA